MLSDNSTRASCTESLCAGNWHCWSTGDRPNEQWQWQLLLALAVYQQIQLVPVILVLVIGNAADTSTKSGQDLFASADNDIWLAEVLVGRPPPPSHSDLLPSGQLFVNGTATALGPISHWARRCTSADLIARETCTPDVCVICLQWIAPCCLRARAARAATRLVAVI